MGQAFDRVCGGLTLTADNGCGGTESDQVKHVEKSNDHRLPFAVAETCVSHLPASPVQSSA